MGRMHRATLSDLPILPLPSEEPSNSFGLNAYAATGAETRWWLESAHLG